MKVLNKQALREAAEKAQAARARLESMPDEDVVLFEDDDIKTDVFVCNKFIVTANPATVLALLNENARLMAERDALRETMGGDNTRAAADIYFQLVEECEIPANGSLVEHVDSMRDELEAEKKMREAAEKRVAQLEASHSKLRESMAAIHNTIRLDGAQTSLAVILNAAKRAHEESAAAAGIKGG
ncbi:ead/Ea22-like family protein [Leclercia adecarboxylata]|uniref:Ead/Ea22-like family protein n=1 Tax=Leclercia adecarboxylata TaxID=83655 RepID=A0AAP9DDJ2_9ENTR|nr:ead/Ea22-like family protein [Leclercia adecarboxylata]QDK20867.1 ead/Ea22-like family protein [Leclercia adecarboxylata]